MLIDLRTVPVYYINLAQDTAKKENMETMLSAMGFESVSRFDAILGDTAIDGCTKSHFHLLSNIKTPCLVLEDDCILNKEFEPIMNVPDDTDAYYLGNSVWGRYASYSGPNLVFSKTEERYRVYNMLATHAVLYISEEYRRLCARISSYHGYHSPQYVDIGIAEIHKYFNIYADNVPLFVQDGNPGSNSILEVNGNLISKPRREKVGQYLPSTIG